MSAFFRTYLLPGFVFQSIVIGGGYGTGREIVEFFLSESPLGGYLGMALSTAIWGVILALGFELARLGKHYDYRSFTKALLGSGWMAFDALAIVSIIVTTAVMGSASGELLQQILGWPPIVGTLLMTGVVAALAFSGSALIERVFAVWSLLLYAVYLALIVAVVRVHSGAISDAAGVMEPDSQWALGGVKYAAYNLAALPMMLFVARHFETRRQALTAGLIGGFLAMFPGALIYTAMLAYYPDILSQSIPAYFVVDRMDMPNFQIVFQIVLFGTFIETGTGMVHGFNERIAGFLADRGRVMTPTMRLGTASVVLVSSVWLADRFGLIALISRGYGVITWGYWLLFLAPVVIVGGWKLTLKDRADA